MLPSSTEVMLIGPTAAWQLLEPLLLLLPRLLMAMFVLPLFPLTTFPPMVRVTIALSLGLALYPMAEATFALQVVRSPVEWVLLSAKEALIGAMLGYALGAIVWVFQSVGELIDNQAGMNNAEIFDPFGGHQGGPLGAFMGQLAVFLIVSIGGLYVLTSLLFESYKLWPATSALPALDLRLTDFAINHLGDIMKLVIKLGTPALLVLVTAELGIGLINRVAPQLDTFHFSMPIKGALAILVLTIGLAHFFDAVNADVARWASRLNALHTLFGTR